MCCVMPPASPAATSVCADRVQQRRLAVVDVTHDRDHRRARLEILVGVLERRVRVGVLGRRDDLDLLVELVGDHLDRVVGQRLRERRHLAEAHQLLDDLRDADAEVLGDVLDGRAGVDADDVGLQRRDVLRDGLLVGAAPAPAAATPRRAVRGTAAGAATGTAAGTARAAAARACESMTTRRTPPAVPGARSPCSEERVGRRWPPAAPAPLPALRLGLRLGLGLRRGLRGEVLRARGAGGAVAEAGALLKHRRAGFFAAPLPRSPWAWACRSTRRRRASRPRRLRRPSPRGHTAFRRLMTSEVGMSYCLASSWTRFLAMFSLSLRCPVERDTGALKARLKARRAVAASKHSRVRMQPGAPAGQGRARIRHRAAVHVSEADKMRSRRDPPAADAARARGG